MSRLAGDIAGLVEEELRAFNVERVYATDRTVNAASIVEAARLLPMMASHRVVDGAARGEAAQAEAEG